MRNYRKLIEVTALAAMLALLLAACGGGSSGSTASGGGSGGGAISTIGAGSPVLSVNTASEVIFTPAIGTPLTASNNLTLTFPSAVNTTSTTIYVGGSTTAGSWDPTNTIYTIPAATVAAASSVNVSIATSTSLTGTMQYGDTENVTYNVYGGTNPFIYVSTTGNDTTGTGSMAAPFASIRQAMASAVAGQAVLVETGTYTVDSGIGTGITVTDGVSLYGGYAVGFGSRDPAANPTTITDTATAATASPISTDYVNSTQNAACGAAASGVPRAPITVGTIITPIMVIDGFTINGSANSSAADTAAVNILSSNNGRILHITNSTLNGGAGSAFSAGIYSTSGTYFLHSDTINGGTSAGLSAGVYSGNNALTINYSAINGGSGAAVNIGLFNDDLGQEDSHVYNSVVYGGGGTHSYGMFSSYNCPAATLPRLMNDTISGGSGTTTSTGIDSYDWTYADAFNDVIDGGSGNSSRGIVSEANAKTSAFDDTIGGGSGWTSSEAVVDQPNGFSDVRNSILFTQSVSNPGATRICVDDVDAGFMTSTSENLLNNDLIACPTALFAYGSTYITSLSTIAKINHFTATLGGNGNISANPAFTSASDWHLSPASPAEVQQGGLNLLGVTGQALVVTLADKDGKVRTAVLTLAPANTGAAGWSMGAYEY